MKFLLGRKLGMTRIYDESGTIRPVTILQAGPCVVTAVKTPKTDGYTAVQIGFGAAKHPTKPILGHLRKSGLKTVKKLAEIRIDTGEVGADIVPGKVFDVTAFSPGDIVTVTGVSKGKGFAGVIKRHGFSGGPATHGSDFHRAPGAIGGRWPQRVVKGRRMAGQMGGKRVTIKGLSVVSIDPSDHLMAVSGAIPGPRRAIIEIRGEEK